ncbi:unnamed protein product [Medioppia subpectinata]|uniref:Uncharacterized protein n=1 Tax=Medioppia subpectinata TaxID=1979941 RepID=A0A7R9PZ23_9ACAR|nr:unnamed protein product [Medioppia subpectinata]CAG2106462.1 unnamed protein product [Medioppia subpectinata]
MSVNLFALAVLLMVVVQCAYSGPIVLNLLTTLASDPYKDLENDPCYKKCYNDLHPCVHGKIPDIDPNITDPAYTCCVAWVGLDCMRSVGEVDCTAAEATTLGALEDKVIAWANAGDSHHINVRPSPGDGSLNLIPGHSPATGSFWQH